MLLSSMRLPALAALAAAGLTGCYVVPLQSAPPYGQAPAPSTQSYANTPAPAQMLAPLPLPAPTTQTFSARLYPSNSDAAGFGPAVATVTNDLNGRGYFQAVIGGEQFQGEATRTPGGERGGVANASGTRGGMLNCRYTMNSATLGSGSCSLNGKASFALHVGG